MARAARLSREVQMLRNEPPHGVACWPVNEDKVDTLHADVSGPTDSPYEGGVFRLEIVCLPRYPFQPPQVRFLTPIYHPNIDKGGRICLDLLKPPPQGTWKPAMNLSTLLASIQLLMATPNPDDGLRPDVSAEYKDDRDKFNTTARAYTRKHATKAANDASSETGEGDEAKRGNTEPPAKRADQSTQGTTTSSPTYGAAS
eukprot:m.297442 g.297442  ORF g.297442 m.297442 type:complete len:200 (+) comp15858_c6_seq31:92-691(+)